MYKEHHSRSILKTISWRIVATGTTALIVFGFTHKPVLAVSVGLAEAVAKMVLYFFHERAWDKSNFGRKTIDPFVLWFTGLSGSGKSTMANKAYDYIKSRGYKIERLDGDAVRAFFPKLSFSKEDRDQHIKRTGFLASILERNGIIVISSFVSPYIEARQFVRGLCRNFIEVYVRATVEKCEERDIKGLYKKAREGTIKNFTGIDDPYEPPENPEIIIDSDFQTPEESFNLLKKKIDKLLT